jgi:ribosome maturation factor RimP
MIEKELIRRYTETAFAGTDKFIVDINVRSGNRITVFMDSDSGVSIKDCHELSRFLEESLNRDQEDFELNVSSPGLDRPLVMTRQYLKNIGKKLEIETINGEKPEGLLMAANDTGIELIQSIRLKNKKEEKVSLSLMYKDIKTARIKIEFKK